MTYYNIVLWLYSLLSKDKVVYIKNYTYIAWSYVALAKIWSFTQVQLTEILNLIGRKCSASVLVGINSRAVFFANSDWISSSVTQNSRLLLEYKLIANDVTSALCGEQV